MIAARTIIVLPGFKHWLGEVIVQREIFASAKFSQNCLLIRRRNFHNFNFHTSSWRAPTSIDCSCTVHALYSTAACTCTCMT